MKCLTPRGPVYASAVAVVLAALGSPAKAEAPAEWPSKPVHIVVPYPPGGSTDSMTRRLADKLTKSLGQPFVVENRPGASGMIGTEQVSRAAPDGYTLVLGNNATHGLNQLLSRRKLVDPLSDFTPIAMAAMMPLALAVHPSVPASNAAELVAWAKANPGKAAYGTAGRGSPHHIAGEMLGQASGGAFVHVPYKGSGHSITDLIGGQVPIVFAALAAVLPHAQSGKIKILGLAENARQKSTPSIPTIGESVPGYAMPPTWLGYLGPSRMDPALTARINAELVKALNDPEVVETINSGGLQVAASTSEEFKQTIGDSMKSLREFLKTTNISMD